MSRRASSRASPGADSEVSFSAHDMPEEISSKLPGRAHPEMRAWAGEGDDDERPASVPTGASILLPPLPSAASPYLEAPPAGGEGCSGCDDDEEEDARAAERRRLHRRKRGASLAPLLFCCPL